jgi:thymidylate kinase
VARERLFRALSPHASRASIFAPLERGWERVRPLVTGGREGHRLASGGSVVALLGGDGSGKSTCADALNTWLASSLATMHVHLGRPTRTLATYVVGGLLAVVRRIGSSTRLVSHLELLRYACTARDRYALYTRAHRFASGGGIAICERYPLPESWGLSGPSETQGKGLEAQSRFAEAVRRWERRFYERMTVPDLLFVLQLDPETAVSRKPSEPADYVRKRAQLTADTDWSNSGARIVDAAQPLPQVIATLKAELWSTL